MSSSLASSAGKVVCGLPPKQNYSVSCFAHARLVQIEQQVWISAKFPSGSLQMPFQIFFHVNIVILYHLPTVLAE